jgi:DNA-directed RNA polymerase subunit omega
MVGGNASKVPPLCQVGRGQEERSLSMSKNELHSKALKMVQSRFLLVNLLTKRIRQLKDGASPLVEHSNNFVVEEIALQEIAEGEVIPTHPMGK